MVYRGADYDPSSFLGADSDAATADSAASESELSDDDDDEEEDEGYGGGGVRGEDGEGEENGEGELKSGEEDITAGLGPKIPMWEKAGHAPVDADMLAMKVEGFRPPLRMVPYGVSSKLSNTEMTKMRKQARRLQPHFMLGE